MKTYLLYYPIFYVGYWLFKITRKTNWYAFVAFRRLFVLTKGRSNDAMSEKLSKENAPYPLSSVSGVLGHLGDQEISKIVSSIDNNGFYVFDASLSESVVNELIHFSLGLEAELIPPAKNGLKTSRYDRSKVLSPRYQFKEQDVYSNPVIQELATDATLFRVAQAYLKCKPVQDLTAMWWSAAYEKEASSEAAQLYHFDMDRFKFIKFFFYLTDVDSSNGPHCYVRGTHKTMPDILWKDGRIQDSEISSCYKKEDILEITGKKGTIMAVDTRGLHKGKVLEKGERLILQFEFTNSLFGATYENIDLQGKLKEPVKKFMQEHAYSYQRFSI